MSDDLTKQLRYTADRRYGSIDSLQSLEWKAADHIEELESKIRDLETRYENMYSIAIKTFTVLQILQRCK